MAPLERLIDRYPDLSSCREQIQTAFDMIKDCYEQDGTLLICGNGGSASDAEHIVGELMKEFARKRPIPEEMKEMLKAVAPEDGEMIAKSLQGSLPALSLTGGLALSTAYANDANPVMGFAQQVYGYGKEGDVLLGISTSGNSKNIVYAMEVAKAKGMETIALTGESGGRLKDIADVCICAPAKETADVQELHLPIYHTLCRMLEEAFFV